jgi:phage tail sheath protein FI
MPEYLSPGVYVEEVSFRAKFIEGVSTSTCGIVGQTSFGPIKGRPEVITSFSEYVRRYGGWDDLVYLSGASVVNHTAHAVRAFFDNGGKRLYVSRAFRDDPTPVVPPNPMKNDGVATLMEALTPPQRCRFTARWPGSYGNKLRVRISLMRRGQMNVLNGTTLRGVYEGAMVQRYSTPPAPPSDASTLPAPTAAGQVAFVKLDGGVYKLFANYADAAPLATYPDAAYLVELQVEVYVGTGKTPSAVYTNLSPSPAARSYVASFLDPDQPGDASSVVAVSSVTAPTPLDLMTYLISGDQTLGNLMVGGNDGRAPVPTTYEGDATDEQNPTGLKSLETRDDISLILASDAVLQSLSDHQSINNHVISHCEAQRYRFAILDSRAGMTSGPVLDFRSKFDTSYAGLYYPWIKIADPREGKEGKLLLVPASGFVAGICARTDIRRGVHKAPANEVVLGAIDFELNIRKGVQDVLNPRGVNCLRFFEQGGFRVWGARTMSSDPEWKYVNVRRLFIFLEASIDRGTQWVVFEPNNERTWQNVVSTIEAFLLDVWKTGALTGTKPEEAFFVRCDRTTMTQNDLDNGRLICLIGVAPAYPAEFVIFRIGQFTADARR